MIQLCACGCGKQAKKSLFLQGHHMKTGKYRGQNSLKWKGGTWVHNGYRHIWHPDHPYRAATGYVLEHRLIAEAAIGRILPRSIPVHHANEQRSDNRNENLVICQDTAYHRLLHQRMRAYKATGNPNSVLCEFCKQWGTTGLDGMHTNPERPNGRRGASYHLACRNEHRRKKYRAKRQKEN